MNTSQFVENVNVFNMGMATMMRIDNILIALHEYNTIGNPILTQRTLYCLYKEIYPFLKIKEKEEGQLLWKNITKEKLLISEDNIKYSSFLFDKMNHFEFWIRDKLKEKKLLMKEEEKSLGLVG